jgi:hypothetical protein
MSNDPNFASSSPYTPPNVPREQEFAQANRKHSGLGISSLILAIVSGVASFASVVVSVILVGGGADESNPGSVSLVIVGLAIIGSSLLSVIGGVVGLVAMFQSNRKKVFGILGLIGNAIVFFGIAGLLIIGIVAGR